MAPVFPPPFGEDRYFSFLRDRFGIIHPAEVAPVSPPPFGEDRYFSFPYSCLINSKDSEPDCCLIR